MHSSGLEKNNFLKLHDYNSQVEKEYRNLESKLYLRRRASEATAKLRMYSWKPANFSLNFESFLDVFQNEKKKKWPHSADCTVHIPRIEIEQDKKISFLEFTTGSKVQNMSSLGIWDDYFDYQAKHNPSHFSKMN